MESEYPICKRCQRPVVKHRELYYLFEQMHWLRFHLEFEHKGDPDEPCDDPSCHWWHIQVFEQKLTQLQHDPEKVLQEAIKERYRL